MLRALAQIQSQLTMIWDDLFYWICCGPYHDFRSDQVVAQLADTNLLHSSLQEALLDQQAPDKVTRFETDQRKQETKHNNRMDCCKSTSCDHNSSAMSCSMLTGIAPLLLPFFLWRLVSSADDAARDSTLESRAAATCDRRLKTLPCNSGLISR
ncbi:unnamed protein product [Polarella glacialis]|uniref:Uncharacterized protein n=1 Tax=Polarella glacialis TaxID=89957 RepID=A0A813LPQ9_POLGL|nr:unnamed protein product [Polarella glacialis]